MGHCRTRTLSLNKPAILSQYECLCFSCRHQRFVLDRRYFILATSNWKSMRPRKLRHNHSRKQGWQRPWDARTIWRKIAIALTKLSVYINFCQNGAKREGTFLSSWPAYDGATSTACIMQFEQTNTSWLIKKQRQKLEMLLNHNAHTFTSGFTCLIITRRFERASSNSNGVWFLSSS